MSLLAALLSQALVASAFGTNRAIPNSLTINTTSGVFAPHFPSSHPDIASFPNIPYAQNPTGSLRFAPPVPAAPPANGTVGYASDLPAGCFQYSPAPFSDTVALVAEKAMIFQRGNYANTTEDCLRLSIFAPKSAVKRAASHIDSNYHDSDPGLPVIVWIHGGGYVFGGTNVPYHLAPNWVQRSQRHIVVQVQYRLSLLGLPNAAGLAAIGKNTNLAFLDQRLAVEWVRANIASLGGDPNRIILWGESAGAYSTDGYLFAWTADPIVAGVIADSGNAIALGPYSTSAANYSQFSHVASRFGCGDLSPATELDCMRAVPESELQTYIQARLGEGGAADDSLAFPTLVDNVTVFSGYEKRITASADQFPFRIPLLIGTNTNEGGAVVPFDFEGSETATTIPTSLAPLALSFKLGLQCTTLREVRLRSAAGARTWQYLYAGNFSDVSPRPWLDAYHAAELPMVFGTFGTEGPATDFERRVSHHMQDMYLAFAENPAKGLARAGWPVGTGTVQKPQIMKWAADGELGQLVDIDELRDECIKNGYDV